MKTLIRDENIEYIARDIGDRYSGYPLSEKLKKIVPVEKVVYPNTKWRMVFDAMYYCSCLDDEDEGLKMLSKIIELAIHPLNISTDGEKISKKIVGEYNAKLSFDDLVIERTNYGKDFHLVKINQAQFFDFNETPVMTSTDYIVDAINYFKDEYNKVRLSGIMYEYRLGVNFAMSDYEPREDEINYAFYRAKAIEQLHKVGFVKTYEIENRVMDDFGVDDYAICTIDESKLTQKEEPVATDYGAQLVQKIVHEHTHRFENSIQEKSIDLNHKYEKVSTEPFYITKKDDDFKYKGKVLNLSRNNDYYKTFTVLYSKLPEGGEIKYIEFIAELKSRIPEIKSKSDEEMRKFIQTNLTDKSNGFMRYAQIPKTEDNGKPLIEIMRASGVRFNNKTG